MKMLSWTGGTEAEFFLFKPCVLLWQLFVKADRYCKPTHITVSLMLGFNIFYTDMINAMLGFPSTADQMLFDLLPTQ